MKNFKLDFHLQVRREKISERMKFLQDLVPGCSKVASKFQTRRIDCHILIVVFRVYHFLLT